MVSSWHAQGFGLAVVLAALVVVGSGAASPAEQAPGQGVQPQQQQQQQQRLRMGQPAPATCRGLGRREVDWWLMLKHPGGYQYSYLDSAIVAGTPTGSDPSCQRGTCWLQRLSMLNPNPVSHTLAVLAAAAAVAGGDTAAAVAGGTAAAAGGTAAAAAGNTAAAAAAVAHVIYNDADPSGTEHWQFAHAKGVAAFSLGGSNSSSDGGGSLRGFWLLHSAPRFPRSPSEPGFAQLQHAQSVFGQHFFCVSLAGRAAISTVAELLLASQPFIYSSSLPAAAAACLPAWAQLLAGNGSSGGEQRAVHAAFRTEGGQQLAGYAKSQLFNASLTDGVVAPGLGCDMLWETWRRSRDALPSFCPGGPGQPRSLNIAGIAFPGRPYHWHWAQDHSKWGISSSSSSGVAGLAGGTSNRHQQHAVCLGDLNRAAWQSHRGGQYVCLQHTALWQALSSIVAAVEPCSS